MNNQKDSFKTWMLARKTTRKDGKTYTLNTVRKCITTLNTVLDKFGISYQTDAENTIFFCDSYSEFLKLDNQLRSDPNFNILDGPGKGQRWIHNGLLLFGNFLLEKDGKTEEDRDDPYESVVGGGSTEGKKIAYYTTKYERKKENRDAAIAIHGLKCQCCGFNFEEKYGELGKGFIEVHHVVPLAYLGEEITVNPKTDLVCVCSNCHRMIHRKKSSILTVDELKKMISAA